MRRPTVRSGEILMGAEGGVPRDNASLWWRCLARLVALCRSDRLQAFLFWMGSGLLVSALQDDGSGRLSQLDRPQTDALQLAVFVVSLLLSRYTHRWLASWRGVFAAIVVGGAGFTGAALCLVLPTVLVAVALEHVLPVGWDVGALSMVIPTYGAGWWLGVRWGRVGASVTPAVAAIAAWCVSRAGPSSDPGFGSLAVVLGVAVGMASATLGAWTGHAASEANQIEGEALPFRPVSG